MSLRFAKFFLLAALSATAFSACDDHDHDHDHGDGGHDHGDGGHDHEDGGAHVGDYTLGRLVVADGTSTLRIIDLDDEASVGTLTLPAAATGVFSDRTSQYAYATTAGGISVALSGVEIESHGEHYHFDKEAPSLYATAFEGDTPGAVTVYGEGAGRYASAFFSGENEFRGVQERSLGATPSTFAFGATATRGESIVAFAHIISVTNAGVTLRELSSPSEGETVDGCTTPEGLAANAYGVFVGCAEGVLVLEHHNDHFDDDVIAYPAGASHRVTALIANDDSDLVVGLYGTDHLGLIAPEAAAAAQFTELDLPADAVAMQFELHGEHFFVLTADGNLHKFHDGEAEGEPLALASTPATPGDRLQMVVGGGFVYVVDSRTAGIGVVHVEDWELEGRIDVSGSIQSIALTSLSPDYGAAHTHE